MCTPFLTVLRIGAGRGDVEKDLEGILIHDDYAAYFTLKGVRHGACNAHHLRELQALIDIEKEDWAKSMHRLLERAHRATRFSRENGRDVPASLVARISRAWARILDHAIAFHEAQPPLRTGKRGRKKRRIGHNLALRLRKHKEGCLRFLTDPRRSSAGPSYGLPGQPPNTAYRITLSGLVLLRPGGLILLRR